ncbi:MAG TPA: 2'-5' RNA ligase family protein [Ferruginibacter sp.]|nr:2'-5' RNA ligase family protein [Ferruginibacter sp.]HMP19952.1 2'-5' RNA ligase family protein [Ferruginibacter sp.]
MQLSEARGLPLLGREKNGQVFAPGYRIYEYLLVLQPHEELRHKIMKVKQEFFEKYKTAAAVHAKPHITLVNFLQYQLMEERMINRLHVIAMGFPPVKIEMKDYGSFPSHTIYINIISKVPIQKLVKEIRSNTQRLMKLNEDNKPHFILEPHLSIARKLQPQQYDIAWKEYSHRHFTGRFIADAMLLLKRPVNHSGSSAEKYEVMQRFSFQNLPVNTVQGDLFGT